MRLQVHLYIVLIIICWLPAIHLPYPIYSIVINIKALDILTLWWL